MIIPALDLIKGKVVRLLKGNFLATKFYDIKPLKLINNYIKEGTKSLHLIDLTGALNPLNNQKKIIINLLKKVNLENIQIGGGIRNIEYIKELFNVGANKIIIGSYAIKKPLLVYHWLKYFGNKKIILSLDVILKNKKFYIAINGWKKISKYLLKDIINFYNYKNIKNIICTDISKDGTLTGSNIKLYNFICKKWPNINFQSSGGIKNINEINSLRKIGINDIIIGKALLENKIKLNEALKCWQKE